jgi:DNA primase
MIPKETIEEIRSKSDIVKVISQYVTLKERGRNFLGLCPFHSEKKPSFTVSPEKQLFHCFGCNEGGNVFAFIMKAEKIDFREAVEELGNKIGVVVEKAAAGGISKTEKEKLYEIMLLAANFFRKNLEDAVGQEARAYLRERKINEATGKTFGLGFAPEGWDHLFKYLIARGADPTLIERAGLTLVREEKGNYYDRFRRRLIFPVFDLRGRVVAFSGRALKEEEPKYLNSPDTPIYQKGENLFGLHLSKENIKQAKSAFLVEGNLDLLALFQAGITNAAAPLGTALTAAQCKLLSRFTENVVLALDADAAGEAAAGRSAELLRHQGLKVKVMTLRQAKDPDEFIGKFGAEEFKKAASSALAFLEFKIKRTLSQFNLAEIEGRAAALRETAKILSREEDVFAQKEYAKMAAQLLRTDLELILAEIKKQSFYRGQSAGNLRQTVEKPLSKVAQAEKKLIALAATVPGARETLKKELRPEAFNIPEARSIAEFLFSLDAEAEGGLHFTLEKLESEPARNFLTRALLSENAGKADQVLWDCIKVIKGESNRAKISALKSELQSAEKSNDRQKASELLSALKAEIY